MLSLLWSFSNIFHWLKFISIVFFLGASIVFMFRRDVINRLSAGLLFVAFILITIIFLFDYNRAPRLSENDLSELQVKIEQSNFEQMLNQIEAPDNESIKIGFSYKFNYNKSGTLFSHVSGTVFVYKDVQGANNGFDLYTPSDNFAFIPKNKFSYYESGEFIAWSSKFTRNFDLTFLPIDNYFTCQTVIQYKNALIFVDEYTDIGWESKTNEVMLTALNYNEILSGQVNVETTEYD